MGWCPYCESELIPERNGGVRRRWRIDADAVVVVCYTEVTELDIECCPNCSFKEGLDFRRDYSLKHFSPRLHLN